MGWVDLVSEQCLKIYDVAGVVPIVTGAGGFISDWNGNPVDINFNGFVVAATSKELALHATEILNRKR
jgi:fructose-1,6-bisphosphatase/inositol monophosphatase family enzyme